MPTENHDYNTPAKGAEDWDVPLNENFEMIDSDVLIRDSESNITSNNYTPENGKAALATDTGAILVGDGSKFISLGYLAPGPIVISDTEPSDPQQDTIWIKRT